MTIFKNCYFCMYFGGVCACMSMCLWAHVPWLTCGGQTTTSHSRFSPFTMIYRVGSVQQTRAVRFVGQGLYPPTHLAGLRWCLFTDLFSKAKCWQLKQGGLLIQNWDVEELLQDGQGKHLRTKKDMGKKSRFVDDKNSTPKAEGD